MTKTEALQLFHRDTTQAIKQLVDALGITRHAIYQWPEELPQSIADRVIGAAARLGKWPPAKRKQQSAA